MPSSYFTFLNFEKKNIRINIFITIQFVNGYSECRRNAENSNFFAMFSLDYTVIKNKFTVLMMLFKQCLE